MLQRVLIYSKHPLALQVIAAALSADETLCEEAVVLGTFEKPRLEFPGQVLLLDSCSQPQWLEIALEWQERGGQVILLAPDDKSLQSDQVRSLYVGVRGVVSFSSDLYGELPRAVRAVMEGGLWINQEILEEYTRRTNNPLQRMDGVKLPLTIREEQVAYFVVQGYSNKQIASALRISERTVKYHVSNILQKSCSATRKQLSVNLLDLPAQDTGSYKSATFEPDGSIPIPAMMLTAGFSEA